MRDEKTRSIPKHSKTSIQLVLIVTVASDRRRGFSPCSSQTGWPRSEPRLQTRRSVEKGMAKPDANKQCVDSVDLASIWGESSVEKFCLFPPLSPILFPCTPPFPPETPQCSSSSASEHEFGLPTEVCYISDSGVNFKTLRYVEVCCRHKCFSCSVTISLCTCLKTGLNKSVDFDEAFDTN